LSENEPRVGLAALEALPEAIIITDTQRIIRFINPVASRLFGVSSNSVVGTPLASLPSGSGFKTPEQLAEFYDRINSLTPFDRQIPIPPPFEQEWLGGAERNRLFRFRSTPMWGRQQQECIGIIFRVDDVTAERTSSNLLATMFNEMVTPLNFIIGCADLLLQDTENPLLEEQRKMITTIRSKAKFLWQLRGNLIESIRKQQESGTDDAQ